MIDSIDNSLQIAVLLICVFTAIYRAFRKDGRVWTLLALFSGSWVLGDLYWLFCLVFFDTTPQLSVVCNLSWYACYIFLYMLLREVAPPETPRERRFLPWLGFVFSLAMAVFYYSFYLDWTVKLGEQYLMWGKALDNLIYGVLMGLLLFSAIRRLMDRRIYPAQRSLCIVVLVFCLLEYGLWTVSCFWWGDTLANPYYWFDFLLTVDFLFFLPAVKKAVAD